MSAFVGAGGEEMDWEGWGVEGERKKKEKKGQTNQQNEYLTNAVSFGVQARQQS